MKAMKISVRIASVLAEFHTEHLLNANLEKHVCFNAVTITDEVQITGKTVTVHMYFVDHQHHGWGITSLLAWPKACHSDVSKMSFRVCHHHTVTYLTISSLGSYYILFSIYDGNQTHHTTYLTEQM